MERKDSLKEEKCCYQKKRARDSERTKARMPTLTLESVDPMG
jgi:hypothetical protein